MGRGLSEQERRILRPASISGRGIESWRGAMTRKRLTDHRVILARQQEQKKFEENAAAELKKWGNREFDKYATELDKVEQNALNREVPLPDASDNESNSVPESLWDDLGIGATGAQKRADWLQAHARENETTDWVDGRGEKPEYVHTPWKTDPVTAAAPTYFPAYDSTKRITFVDGSVWANNPVALAVVEAITLLQQSPENIDVLSIGCTDETINFKHGWHTGLFWLQRGIFAAMRGQSRSALGMAVHLTGRDRGEDHVLRIDPAVAENRFSLDDSKKIHDLEGLGYSEARHALPQVRERFFSEVCKPFAPVYK